MGDPLILVLDRGRGDQAAHANAIGTTAMTPASCRDTLVRL
jgi:hypothetical protein